jgi:hypothetical protein
MADTLFRTFHRRSKRAVEARGGAWSIVRTPGYHASSLNLNSNVLQQDRCRVGCLLPQKARAIDSVRRLFGSSDTYVLHTISVVHALAVAAYFVERPFGLHNAPICKIVV